MLNQRANVEIDAVLDEELDALLEQLGIRQDLDMGRCSCRICNDVVNRQNLKVIVPSGERIEFVCDKPSCMIDFALPE